MRTNMTPPLSPARNTASPGCTVTIFCASPCRNRKPGLMISFSAIVTLVGYLEAADRVYVTQLPVQHRVVHLHFKLLRSADAPLRRNRSPDHAPSRRQRIPPEQSTGAP